MLARTRAYEYEFSILLVGAQGVGKTSILSKFIKENIAQAYLLQPPHFFYEF